MTATGTGAEERVKMRRALRLQGWLLGIAVPSMLAAVQAGDLYPCTDRNDCGRHVVAICAGGPNVGKVCLSDTDCGGYACRPTWEEHFVDAGRDMTCVDQGFGGSGADGVDVKDFDGDGDYDIVTGWEESGVTYVYRNPCNPADPLHPAGCTNNGNVRRVWHAPWSPDPYDVRGGAYTTDIEDATFADFDLDGRPDGVVSSTEGLTRELNVHGLTHLGTWLGRQLPGNDHLWMQARTADINGDGCADIVAGNKVAFPPCLDTLLPDPCSVCKGLDIPCDDIGGIWWYECPKVDGVCQPFGPKFADADPKINLDDWNKRRIDSGFDWIMSIELADMDGDGDNDVLYSDRLEIGWFENRTDEGNLAGWGTPIRIDTKAAILDRKDGADFDAGEPFRFLAYGDVDGDGLKDIVSTVSFGKGFCSASRDTKCALDGDCPGGETCDNNSDRFAGYFYRRTTASGRSWAYYRIFVKGGLPYGVDFASNKVSKGVAIGDVTGDGQTDLVFAARGKGHVLYSLSYQRTGPNCLICSDPEWIARPIAPCRKLSKYDNVQLADIDLDGRLDVISTEENFAPGDVQEEKAGLGVVWYRNLGLCGNGVVDGESGEECDNGAANGMGGQCCTEDCRLRTGQVCRESTNQCDAAEVCGPDSGNCPVDVDRPAGTPCTQSACDALPYQCNAEGVCAIVPEGTPCTQNTDCATGLCLLNFCAAGCPDDGNPCTNDVCNGGLCQHPPKAPATLCGDGVSNCSLSQCDGGGNCQTTFFNAGLPCGPNPTAPCDQYDECDGAGTCVPKIRPAGAICRFSVGDCDVDELCDGIHTSCPPDLYTLPGVVCADPPPRSCDQDEHICFGYCSEYQCNANRDCVEVGFADGQICYDDGNECSVHTCTSTWCIRGDVGFGTPCTDDGISCTDDWCNGITCTHTPNPNPDPCDDDGNPCTDDVCDIFTGECSHIPVPGRLCDDDGDVCTENVCGEDGNCYPPAPDETPCADDGSVCTQDFCVAGVCTHPSVLTPTTCESDENECTDDLCITGECRHLPLAGQSCTDDGSDCTTDVCDKAGLCTHPAVVDLQPCAADGNGCTKDHCTAGTCTHPPEDAGLACGDPTSAECNGADACDGAGNCAANLTADATPCTPDQLDCTVDECRGGVCVHAAELPLPTGGEDGPEPLCGGHALLPVGNPPNDVIRAFAVFDDGNGPALYAGGTMLHKWDGVSWTQIDLPVAIADTILAMDVTTDLPFGSGQALYIGGSLVEPLNGPQPLFRWDGTTWMQVGSFNGPIHAMEAVYDTLYVGGAFTTVDFTDNGGPVSGFVVNHVARLAQMDLEFDPPNVITTWEALGTGTDDDVHALSWGLYSCTGSFDRLGVGGAFTTAGGLPATGFAYWNLNSGSWGTVDPLLPPEGGTVPVVHTIAAFSFFDSGRSFYIGGLFRVPSIDSPTGFVSNVASLQGCGSNWWGGLGGPPGSGVTSGGLDAVRTIARASDESGPAAFIGGEFGSFNDVVTPQIARVESWTYSLGSCLNGSVEAMLAFDDGSGEALYVGGLFTNSTGEHFVARWRGLPGDLDGDGIVTAADYTFSTDVLYGMRACQNGPASGAYGTCSCSDLNKDDHVDMRDVAMFMILLGTTD